MFEIINKQILATNVKRLDIYAPHIARRVRPGQFISVCPEEGEERIPLTVSEVDAAKGTITLIFQEVGHTTGKLGSLPINDTVFSILGPLGIPSKIENAGTVVCVATGVGIAQILPICRALKDTGNKVIGIMGAKTKRALVLEPQLRLACHKIFIATNDGSYERRGMATDLFKEIFNKHKIDRVYTIGSVSMMQEICMLTQSKNIPTRVHLNPVMVDCMGMCGSCRVKIGGKTLLACLDGPEFDGHQVDFDHFKVRMQAFEEPEQWQDHKFPSSRKRSELKTLTRFLSGILRN